MEGFKDLQDMFKSLGDERFMLKAVSHALSVVAKQIRSDVIPNTPRDTGDLLNSWRIEKQKDNLIEVGFDIIYAAYQERGMREDGTKVIQNRPAGGKTRFLGDTVDDNLEKYYAIFNREVFAYIETRL